jgi:hypothetical protein
MYYYRVVHLVCESLDFVGLLSSDLLYLLRL